MLIYRTLEIKPSIKPAGFDEEMPDLFALTYKGGASCNGVVEVTEPYISRPDLISLAVYGDDRYADVLCKFNGISNPFDLNEGMLLFIPEPSEISKMFEQTPHKSVLADKETAIINIEKGFKKKRNEKRSPNQLVEGEINYYVDNVNNFIIY